MADWSEVPLLALRLISNRLPSDLDYVNFRSVCTSWRGAATPRPKVPWLLTHRQDPDRNYTIFSFFNLFGEPIELKNPSLGLGMPCCGSSHGWICLLNHLDPSVVLFNPLTETRIQLPKFTHFPMVYGHLYRKIGSQYFISRPNIGRHREFQDHDRDSYLVNKVILSSDPGVSSDYVVLAIRCRSRRLESFKASDKDWSLLEMPKVRGMSNFFEMLSLRGINSDAVFYNGRFYVAVNFSFSFCNLEERRLLRVMVARRAKSKLERVDEVRLVESNGDLLLVRICYNDDWDFEIYKLDEGRQRLVNLESLGGRALFLGRNHGFSLSARQVPGTRANYIYFVPSHRIQINADSDWEPCAWFTPSLLKRDDQDP